MEKKAVPNIVTNSTHLKAQSPFPSEFLRTYCVSVRLNKIELQHLNTKRGPRSKGEWLRMALLNQLPPIVPSINIESWKVISEISQRLTRIAAHIDSKSENSKLTPTELFAVKRELKELRQKLINADIWSKPDEGYAEDKTR